MTHILTALFPIFALIVVGFVLRRRHVISDDFWSPSETLNYFCLFPALMFRQVQKSDLSRFSLVPIGLSLLGAIIIGASLNVGAARLAREPVLLSSFVKLSGVPVLTLWLGMATSLRGTELAVVVLFNALPCTPSAYIMAKLLGGDHALSAGIITTQTALAFFTMPLVLMLCPA
jgi:predicted permease